MISPSKLSWGISPPAMCNIITMTFADNTAMSTLTEWPAFGKLRMCVGGGESEHPPNATASVGYNHKFITNVTTLHFVYYSISHYLIHNPPERHFPPVHC